MSSEDRGPREKARIEDYRRLSIFSPPSSLVFPGLLWWIAVSVDLIVAPSAGAWDEVIESVMYRSPELPKPREITVFPKGLVTLWVEALRRPEADSQCQAALTIALAHRHGVQGLERAVTPLLESLERHDQYLSVRLAAAQALIELDAREAADRLFVLAESGDRNLRDLIEPALAHWDRGGPSRARALWLERLGKPPGEGFLLAVRGLGIVREQEAVPALHELMFSRQASFPVRLESARALGQIRTAGLEKDARQLIAESSSLANSSRTGEGDEERLARLAAASLLRRHQGDEAVRLLQDLATDPEPAVAVVALARLLEIDANLVVPALNRLLPSYDPKVRSFAIDVLFRKPSADHIKLLGDRLNDAHPELRVKARKSLHELAAKAEFREAVIREDMRIVSGADWRGQEQSAILLTQLDHKPVAGRLVELLDSDRAEVLVAAGWGLRRLAVPDTLPAAFQHFQVAYRRQTNHEAWPGTRPVPREAVDQQLCQLAQFFGLSRYRSAEPALRRMVPRPANPQAPVPVGQETRAAAIWALGLFHEGQPSADLVQALESRVSDIGGFMIPPEDYRVRSLSAVSLARMKAKDALETLRKFYPARKANADRLNNACGWAIEQLTGEVMLPPDPVEIAAESFKNWLRPFTP
jgi:HEAT repeat protein